MVFANIFLHCLIFIQSAAVFGAENCGSSAKVTGLIIGGKFSENNQWPWLAALIKRSDETFFCGGTLISKRHVLTAAHCIQPKSQARPIKFDEFVVYFGKHNLSEKFEDGSTHSHPLKVLMHNDWNYRSDKYDADIAIIFFEYDVGFTQKIAPICLTSTLSLNKKGTVVDIFGKVAWIQIIWTFPGRLGNLKHIDRGSLNHRRTFRANLRCFQLILERNRRPHRNMSKCLSLTIIRVSTKTRNSSTFRPNELSVRKPRARLGRAWATLEAGFTCYMETFGS